MERNPGTDSEADSSLATEGRSVIGLGPILLAVMLCAVLTLPVAWNFRERIGGDGLSYLEEAINTAHLGPGYLFTNGYWSPAYPALLALTMKLLHPSLASELTVVHGFDWLICVATYFSFTYFLLNLIKWIHRTHGPVLGKGGGLLGIVAFAYSLLFVSNIDVSLWLVGPNVMIEGVVYLIAGVCLRLSLPGTRIIHYAALGASLALGYATKTVLFPLSLVLLTMLFVWPSSHNLGRRGTAVAAGVFLLGVSPLVAALSYNKGRPTFGDAGSLTYAWYVNDVPRYWEVVSTGSDRMLHPPRMISTNPVILKFDGPFKVTYPYWYDPSYWYDGLHSRFNIRGQIRTFLRDLGLAPKMMFSGSNVFQLAGRWIPIWAGLAAFAVLGLRTKPVYHAVRTQIWMLLWPAAACFTFACVLLEYRYLVPFIVLGWTVLFVVSSVVTESGKALGVTMTVAIGLLLAYVPGLAKELKQTWGQPAESRNLAIAADLKALGIQPGDELASIGWTDDTYYARLAGAHFTIQMLREDPAAGSKLPEADVKRILAILRANGAKALFSAGRPAFANDSGWVRIGERDYVRILQ